MKLSNQKDISSHIRVLEIVAEKKASFPSEVSPRTEESTGKVGEILRELEEIDLLESLTPKMKKSDQRLLDRRNELWGRGKRGIDEFRQPNWYGLNSDRKWRLKTDDGLRIIDEYHRIMFRWNGNEWISVLDGEVISTDFKWSLSDHDFVDLIREGMNQ